MNQQDLTILNLEQSLDDLANLDPRGYGVCKILYKASRAYTGCPTSMTAAGKLADTVKAFRAKPIIICPADSREAVKNMASCVGLHLFEDIRSLLEIPALM